MSFSTIRLKDLLNELGEEFVNQLISEFSCPLNADVEHFLKEKAILFQRMDISRTHLVFSEHKKAKVLVGYFALAMKVLPIRKGVSGNMRKRLTGSKSNEIHSIPAILIGQLSKNFAKNYNKLITGQELLWLALRKVVDVNQDVAGRVVFLECVDDPHLISFYRSCGFEPYDTNPDGLLQLIRYNKDIELR